jgi:hypothetical protein
MRMSGPRISIAMLAIVGCTKFQPIADGVCGNAVLDPGEDCDTFAELGADTVCAPASDMRGCHYVCDGSAHCPSGWRCGVDAQCRHPSGSFLAPATVPFGAERISVGDADGDRIGDILGNGASTLSVLYGGPDQARDELRMWSIHSPPEWRDVDGDGRIDAIVPTGPGTLVFLGTSQRRLTPATFAAGGASGMDAFGMAMHMDKDLLGDSIKLALFGGCLRIETGFSSSLCQGCSDQEKCINGACVPEEQTCAPGRDGVCDGPFLCKNGRCSPVSGCAAPFHVDYPTKPGSRQRYVFDDLWTPPPIADVYQTGNDAFALAFKGSGQVYVYATVGSPRSLTQTASQAQIVSLAPGYGVRGPVFFTDVDGDGKVDLMIPAGDGQAQNTGFNVAFFDPTSGRFGAACPAVFKFYEPNDRYQTLGHSAELRATADLSGDGMADYVFGQDALIAESISRPQSGCSDGAPVVVECVQAAVPGTDGAWSEATVGAYSGSGHMDAAASSPSTLDLLLGSSSGLTTIHVDVPSPASLLRSGDFDGDGIDDVLFGYAQPGGGGPSCPVKTVLAVLFGPPSASAEPVVMGSFCEAVLDWQPFDSMGIETVDAAKDLLISTAETNRTTVLYGSPGRRMLCPAAFASQSSALTSFIGHFCTRCTSTSCPSASDLAYAQYRSVNGVPAPVLALARSDGLEPGGLASVGNIDYGDKAIPWTGQPPAMSSIDLDEDGLDDVVGWDSDGTMMLAHRNGVACAPDIPMAELPAAFDPAFSKTPFFGTPQIQTSDLDHDGHLDVIAQFGTSSVAVAFGSGRVDLHPSAIALPMGKSIIQVTHAELGCDSVPDLLVLAASANVPDGSDAAIYSMRLDPKQRVFGGWMLLAPAPFARSFAAGDVNGDGLNDLVWTDGSSAHVLLARPGVGPTCEVAQ